MILRVGFTIYNEQESTVLRQWGRRHQLYSWEQERSGLQKGS